MGNMRVWLFRCLVIIATSLMLVTWLMPWWTCDILGLPLFNAVTIHPYGLEQALGEWVGYIAGSEMPVWFAPLMWTYLGICIVSLSFSLLPKGEVVGSGKLKLSLSQVIIGGVGVSYIAVAVLATIVAAIRTGDFFGGLPLQGSIELTEANGVPYPTLVDTRLLPGYYLVYFTGLFFIALGLLRNKIIGKH